MLFRSGYWNCTIILAHKILFTYEQIISFKYEGEDELYCIVRGNHFITPIIIDDDNKIIAFFTGIVKNKDNIVPYVLEGK